MATDSFNGQSDEVLMELYKTGNTAAFEVLFARYGARVMSFLLKRTSLQKETHDLVQDVFLKLHRSKHLYNRTLPFAPWLFSITRSVWLDHLKKPKREFAVDHERLESLQNGNLSDENSGPRFTSEALAPLPQSQREAVSLRVFDDATFEEIALRLSTSPENARQLVSRGLKRLRDFYKIKKD